MLRMSLMQTHVQSFDPSNVINSDTVPEDQCTRDNQQAAIDMKSRNSHNTF